MTTGIEEKTVREKIQGVGIQVRQEPEIFSLDRGEDGDEVSQMWIERANWQRLLICFVLNSYIISVGG